MSVTNPYISTSAVYGPVNSRRLGKSLGINFFYNKLCNLDCVYCYLGRNIKGLGEPIPADKIVSEFKDFISSDRSLNIDFVTFCGNGEPTIHPEFPYIVSKIKEIKNNIMRSNVGTAIFSNATTLHKSSILITIADIDRKFFKFDIVDEKHFRLINKPENEITYRKVIENLKIATREGLNYTLDAAIVTYLLKMYTKDNYYMLRKWMEVVFDIFPPEVNLYTIIYHPDIFEEEKLKRKIEEDRDRIMDVSMFIKDNLEKGGIPCKIYI